MGVYRNRIIDNMLKEELEAMGAVLIVGPKWCGKTTTASVLANSVLYMQDPDNSSSNIELAKVKPSRLLDGENPRLIDEWQMAPELWDAVRFSVDQKGEPGLYILTGSTSVDEKAISHSGAGRISRILMRTMSLYESGDSTGEVSLKTLFNNKEDIKGFSKVSIEDMAELIVRGGWPGSIDKKLAVGRKQIAAYCNTITNSDVQTVDGVKRNAEKARAVLKSYSRNMGTSCSESTIIKDSQAFGSVSRDTVKDYLEALRKLFIIEDLQAWSPKLRSKAAIRTGVTRFFTDPAIAAYFLDAGPDDLLSDLNTYGFLFEALVIRDLRIYAEGINGRIYHYRDKNGLEADAIIHLDNGKWAAVEVKLGSNRIDEGVKNLLKLASLIDEKKMGKPEFLMVVTCTEYAYEREDGVLVVPIATLKD